MNNLLKLLKKGSPKREIKYGIVRQIETNNYRCQVELDSGLKTWVRYNGVLDSPSVGDAVLVGGATIQFVIQSIEGVIPQTHIISNV